MKNKWIISQVFLMLSIFGFSQTQQFYFFHGTNPNNGSTTNTGNTWNTTSFPTYNDADNNPVTNIGCLTMNYVATINGGTYVNSTGSTTGSLTPKWQNVGAGNDYYGQRIYVDFSSSNPTTSYATIRYTFAQSSSPTNLSISFDIFDINCGAYTLTNSGTDKSLNFIDVVEVTAKNAAGTTVNPLFSNKCGTPNDDYSVSNTIKGNNSCGSTPNRDVTVSFASQISEFTIKYMPGIGNPGNVSTGLGTGWPQVSTDNPNKQFIDISPIRTSFNCSILPITLMDFDVLCKSDLPLVTWSTASENNNNYFTVLRSTDGINFNPIATVYSQGNGNGIQNYSYTDIYPLNGYSYYKLKQTDFSNIETEFASRPYFKNCSDLPFDIIVLSNPFSNELNLNLKTTVSAQISMSIYDVLGQEVKKVYDNEFLEGETTSITLNTDELAQSIYFLTGNINNEPFSVKLIKAK